MQNSSCTRLFLNASYYNQQYSTSNEVMIYTLLIYENIKCTLLLTSVYNVHY